MRIPFFYHPSFLLSLITLSMDNFLHDSLMSFVLKTYKWSIWTYHVKNPSFVKYLSLWPVHRVRNVKDNCTSSSSRYCKSLHIFSKASSISQTLYFFFKCSGRSSDWHLVFYSRKRIWSGRPNLVVHQCLLSLVLKQGFFSLT